MSALDDKIRSKRKACVLNSVFLFYDLVKDVRKGIIHLFTVFITSAFKMNRRL